MEKITPEQFAQDIFDFIAKHPYLKQEETELEIIPQEKIPEWYICNELARVHTVDGDYEYIDIQIKYSS